MNKKELKEKITDSLVEKLNIQLSDLEDLLDSLEDEVSEEKEKLLYSILEINLQRTEPYLYNYIIKSIKKR